MSEVFMIHAAHIPSVWGQVSKLLEPAAAIFATHDIDDVRKEIMGGNKQLWADWNGEAKAAAVTEFVSYPKGLALRIWLFGAKSDVEVAWEDFKKKFIEFAQLSKCKWIEHCGRDGWIRRDEKHKKLANFYRMEI